MTDPQRVRRDDPGNPDLCPIYDYHRIYSTEGQKEYVQNGCRTAGIGCIECKTILTENVLAELVPFRARREELLKSPDTIRDIIEVGNIKACDIAEKTMEEVRGAMKI